MNLAWGATPDPDAQDATAPRLLDADAWQSLGQGAPAYRFTGLWVASGLVHVLLEHDGTSVLFTTALEQNGYPSLAAAFPQAAWFERLAHDSTGASSLGAIDLRPAIAHAGLRPKAAYAPGGADAAWPHFIETPCEGGFQSGEGPIAGIMAQPVHRRFSLDGCRVLRLEHRLGYAHRGISELMRGKSPRLAARFAARITGDATVAHSVAFARAAEAASRVAVPSRAVIVRAAMLDIERVTTDLAALGASVERAGDLRYAGLLGQAREAIAAAAGACFSHRLMMDIVVPGGLALDIKRDAMPALIGSLRQARGAVRAFGWGRVRRDLGAAGKIALARARSVQSLAAAIPDRLAALPEGPIVQTLPAATGAGIGAAASARGMVHHWLDLRDGDIAAAFFIDPSARLLAILEVAMVGLDYEDAARMIACYGLSVAAIDG